MQAIPDGSGGIIAFWEKNLNYGGIWANRILPDGSLGYPHPELQLRDQQKLGPLTIGGKTISFNLSQATHVTLQLFDLLGRKVLTLDKGFLPAGQHLLRWDGSNLASGVYLLRLKTPSEQQVVKMTIAR